MMLLFLLVPPAICVAAAVLAGHYLDGNGDHTRRGVRRNAREDAREQAAGFPPLGTAGRLPDVPDEDDDDWWTQPPPADSRVIIGPPGDPYETGEMPALMNHGYLTAADLADHLAAKYMPAPEATP